MKMTAIHSPSPTRYSPMTTCLLNYTLPNLNSALTQMVTETREYKSGANYKGQIRDNRRAGHGIFTWPNGAKYDGEFIDNMRHGHGIQEWPDGSCYKGDFVNNMRHGEGSHKWANSETYIGRFFRDRRHGHGSYTWADGSRYEGTFYMDKKEGYGKFYFANGNVFEGLYGSDERYGPGVLTYDDGTADVGLWNREKLVRLCTALPDTFTITEHPEFAFFPEEQIKYIDTIKVSNRSDVVGEILVPQEEFSYEHRQDSDLLDRANRQIFSDTLHLTSLAMDISSFHEAFFEGAKATDSKISVKESVKSIICSTPVETESNNKIVKNRIIEEIEEEEEEEEEEAEIDVLLPEKSQESLEDISAERSQGSAGKQSQDQSQRQSQDQSQRQSQESIQRPSASSSQGSIEGSKDRSQRQSQESLQMRSKDQSQRQSQDSLPRRSQGQSKESLQGLSEEPSQELLEVQVEEEDDDMKVKKMRVEEEKETEPKTDDFDDLNRQIVAWNNTPSSINMQRHVLKHDRQKISLSFNVQDILDSKRSVFPAKGPIEKDSEDFILAAQHGHLPVVNMLLHKERVHVDVCDKNGHTALIGASVNLRKDVINSLLDNGADVNRLNNEGISSLAACHVFFYPIKSFKYNIAERQLERPIDFEQEKGYDVNEVVKGLASAKKRAASIAPDRPLLNSGMIEKLQEEYNQSVVKESRRESKIAFEIEKDSPTDNQGSGRNSDITLGTLNVKRADRTNINDMMVKDSTDSDNITEPGTQEGHRLSINNNRDLEGEESLEMEEFESHKSVRNLPINVPAHLIEHCAISLTQNQMVVSLSRVKDAKRENIGTVRRLAMDKSNHQMMQATIRLLLRRGADPNSSSAPMPVLFFAIKAADVEAVRVLLLKGASAYAVLSDKIGGLSPLHIASAIPGEAGVVITELLLNALAYPDARATIDDSFLNRSLEEEWSKDVISPYLMSLSGGRTPLHIACARDDNYKNACRIVHLLLSHHANPNLLCNGHSPLALAIASGNDLAIDELLAFGADPCLPLTHGIGNALCIAANTEYEHRRKPQGHIHLLDKLIRAGADILAPITIGPKRIIGTAVDYAYYTYNLDRRIAHMPYHALNPAERETYNTRRHFLNHMGNIIRAKAISRERKRLEAEEKEGLHSVSPGHHYTYTGAGALPQGIMRAKTMQRVNTGEGKVTFGKGLASTQTQATTEPVQDYEVRKPLFRYCYDCGRSVGVRLSACTRCKEVYFCSKACKLKSWNRRHKEECIRIGDLDGDGPGPTRAGGSPTPTTDPQMSLVSLNKMKLPNIDGHSSGLLPYGGYTKGQSLAQRGYVPTPPMRRRTFPGAEVIGQAQGRIKVQMKINIRSRTNSTIKGKIKSDMYTMHLPGVVPPTPTKGKGGQHGKLPALTVKSSSFHGLASMEDVTTYLPHLKSLTDMKHVKYIFIDNYSFN